MVLESVNATLKPLQDFTDMLTKKHFRGTLLADYDDDSELTRDIKRRVLAYMKEKYHTPATAELLEVCSSSFKLYYANEDYIADITKRGQEIRKKRGQREQVEG